MLHTQNVQFCSTELSFNRMYLNVSDKWRNVLFDTQFVLPF